jgi:pimeloyl-ACP methyl ester carboxylesterase
MSGFSASGMFTSRFALLHPDRLKAAACGSPGGWPIAPVSSWQGTALRYPCGISDLASLVGAGPNLPAFNQLPLFIYVGSVDTNDALDTRGMTTAERAAINALLKYPTDPFIANRWPTAEAIYRSVGSVATFKTYPGVAHSYSVEMINDMVAFFAAHR